MFLVLYQEIYNIHICIIPCVTLRYIYVNTNSKYKEDNFTDSIAVNYYQDVCTHPIHFRHETHICNPRSSPLYTPQQSVRLGELGW